MKVKEVRRQKTVARSWEEERRCMRRQKRQCKSDSKP